MKRMINYGTAFSQVRTRNLFSTFYILLPGVPKNVRLNAELPSCKRIFFAHPVLVLKQCNVSKNFIRNVKFIPKNVHPLVKVQHVLTISELIKYFSTEGGKPVDKMKEARRINKQGQIIFVFAFVIFQIVFWSVGMAEFYSDKSIDRMTLLEEIREIESKKKI